MKKTKIGHDPFQKKDIFKMQYDSSELPNTQLFNSDDVIVGNPQSNIAIGFVYNWKDDMAPKRIREFFQKVSNYAYLTGFWKTTNGTRYVFSNILANPNVNKLILFVFGSKDNGHLLVDALVKFWEKGINEKGIIIGSNAPNPKFEQVPPDALDRIKKQIDLVVLRNINYKNCPEEKKEEEEEKVLTKAEELIKTLYQEPGNATEVKSFNEKTGLKVEFYSEIIKNNKLYDDGCRFFDQYKLDLSSSAKKVEFIEKYSNLPLGQTVHADNLQDALEMVTAFVYEKGDMFRDQRGIITMESRSFSVTIKNVLEIIPFGFSDEYIQKYIDEFMHGKGEGLDEFAYTYHSRIFKKWGNQVEKAIKLLNNNPNTRRCLISLWDPESDLENKSPPCLDFIWFVIRDNKLEMHTVYRSHHLATITKEGKLMEGEGGFVPNLYALGTLHQYIADSIKVKRGPIVLTDFSGHLYMSNV